LGARFHSPKTHQGEKGITVEPMLGALGEKEFLQIFHFFVRQRFADLHEAIRGTEVTVIFWNFVFQQQVIPECVPGQIRDQAMILMAIVAEMSKNQVGIYPRFKRFKEIFD
jgi:hypothetical protein